jgi:hypothetical protein
MKIIFGNIKWMERGKKAERTVGLESVYGCAATPVRIYFSFLRSIVLLPVFWL